MNAPATLDALSAPSAVSLVARRRSQVRQARADHAAGAVQTGAAFELTMQVLAAGLFLATAGLSLWVVVDSVVGVL